MPRSARCVVRREGEHEPRALALAARVWVKGNEARLMRGQREGGPLGEVLPDFPDPRQREARPAEEARGGSGTSDRAAAG